MDLSKVKTGQIRCNFTDGVHFAYMATQAGVASYRNATPPLTLQLCIQGNFHAFPLPPFLHERITSIAHETEGWTSTLEFCTSFH
ncbi:hypothetical protein DAI22_02g255900 [Oryza sativa Japonica Group]|uniref:Uncharacterized protein n=1 Tax=Oryza rufipogon TaxID=4529 RepID=A0A0E0NI35_ORYRU|nr:hypothetical protein DAI22_02g255900 [Oryza sativa Japonica Group]